MPGRSGKAVLIYAYHAIRNGSVAKEFLRRDFKGYVQTDGYGGYYFLDNLEGVRHIGCLAHSRRKFMDIVKAQGKSHKIGSADMALK